MAACRKQGRGSRRGFTLIELLVVLAILALLLTIAAPRYIQHVERARETTLRSSLKVMREAIDKFQGDQGRFPASLDELVERSYLKSVPVDPITDRRDSWVVLSEAELPPVTPSGNAGNGTAPRLRAPSGTGVADVHSGAPGKGDDGTAYQDW
jgi:general secretion pathway protein G